MTTATDMLTKYMAAEEAILLGKDVTFGGRRLSMESLPEIRAGRLEWEMRVQAETPSTRANPSVGKLGGRGFSVARLDK